VTQLLTVSEPVGIAQVNTELREPCSTAKTRSVAVTPFSAPTGCRAYGSRKIYGLMITQTLNATVPQRPLRRRHRRTAD
jgi:hypothetical protein